MRVAIIPSSTKSHRLPGKNIALVNGKPMMAYPVEAAQKSGMFDQIIVSTADQETREIAEGLGCKVFPSPAALRAKTSTVANVCRNVLNVLADVKKVEVEYFCCVFATALFLEPDDFHKSFELLNQTDFVMGVSGFNFEPLHALVEENGFLRKLYPKSFKYKSHSLPHPRQVSSNGTLTWCRTTPFLALGTFYGPRLLGYEIPLSRCVDIDTPEDYELARKLMIMPAPAVSAQ